VIGLVALNHHFRPFRGTEGSNPPPSCGESFKPSVLNAMEGSGIGAGGRTARNRILPMVASGGPGNLL